MSVGVPLLRPDLGHVTYWTLADFAQIDEHSLVQMTASSATMTQFTARSIIAFLQKMMEFSAFTTATSAFFASILELEKRAHFTLTLSPSERIFPPTTLPSTSTTPECDMSVP